MNYLQGNTLLRYLLNQCSAEETQELTNWLDESQQNRNTLNYLRMRVNLMSSLNYEARTIDLRLFDAELDS